MQEIRDVNYFALDLELNNLKNGEVPKIIQVGIAIGSPTNSSDIKRCNWFLNPEEAISPFITQLTGITDDMVQNQSVTHEQLVKEMGALINVYDCFPNPITWGQGDAIELKSEFAQRSIHFPFFGRRIIDVKTTYVFLEQVNGRSPSGSLSKSMRRYGMSFSGTPHNAEDDAHNTLRFYFHLMNRQRKLEEMMASMKSISY